MKYRAKLFYVLTISFFAFQSITSQCDQMRTIDVCDMQTIDGDSDPGPDGIINLYDETGTTTADGVWRARPRYTLSLDSLTGNVRTWNFIDATEAGNEDEYRFELYNTTCGDSPFITVDLIISPFSGVAAPPQANGANAEICETTALNLFETLTQDEFIPAPHLNGEWQFISNSSGADFGGTFDLSGSSFSATIPRNDEDNRSIDSEIFTLRYVVNGITNTCDNSEATTVKVSVVRQVDPGEGKTIEICENDILDGNWDIPISLNDDMYLEGEDPEGFWLPNLDPTGQISNEQDSIINIREIYNDLIDNGNNLRFGCRDYTFTYFVPQRTPVCVEQRASVTFTIKEELRPFQQTDGIPELCINQEPNIFSLYTLLEFTETNNQLFEYDTDRFVDWRWVSGPNEIDILRGLSNERHKGEINLNGTLPGTYVFEYGVHPEINCNGPGSCSPFVTDRFVPGYCEATCPIVTTLVTFEILPFDYAGENTDDLIFCDTDQSVNLISLLETNGTDTVVPGGVWRDLSGNIVENEYNFPVIDSVQRFNFTYTTTTAKSCTDSANLEFDVYRQVNAGEGTDITLCSDDLNITLFELLTQTPDTTGIWTGPFGYESEDHRGVFDTDDTMLPILGQGTYTYFIEGNEGCPDSDQATVNITINEPISIGNNVFLSYCLLDGRVNLYDVLDRATTRTGVFRDIQNTNAINEEGVVTFDQIPGLTGKDNVTVIYEYVVPNQAPCDESTLEVEITIIDIPEPVVEKPQFCILDAKRLEDISIKGDEEGDNGVINTNWYTTLESDMPVTTNPILFDNDIYYVAFEDAESCESERIEVIVDILNVGEKFDSGDLCTLEFQDGVSPDGNNQNDTFALLVEEEFNIPEAFPDFNLQIFNRYGTLVYEANRNTEEFRGESNTSVRLGDDLPSGTYFYIFNPNFDNNLPIQGSFYLAR